MGFFSNAQCNITFNDLVKALRSNESNLKHQLLNKGYVYNNSEANYFCGNEEHIYIFRKIFSDGAMSIEYMLPNSPTTDYTNDFLNGAKSYGMKLTKILINGMTGLPINEFLGENGELGMSMEISGNCTRITLVGLKL